MLSLYRKERERKTLKPKIRVVLVKNQKERLKMAIKIDEARKTLVITAGFKKKASVFNSEEYTLLRQAKNENPGFKVEVRKTKRKNSPKHLSVTGNTRLRPCR
jgi:hypothetical protein